VYVVLSWRLSEAIVCGDVSVGVGVGFFFSSARHRSRWVFIKASFMRLAQIGQGTRPSSGRALAFRSRWLHESEWGDTPGGGDGLSI